MRRNRRPSVALLVTDLDNTLYDWFAAWHASFSALLDSVTDRSGIPQSRLEPEIREIHQERGTSEYALLLSELPSLRSLHPNEKIEVVYEEAIHAYRSHRKRNTRLYPEVWETLIAARQSGVRIVAYTESFGFYSGWRVKELGLDGVIDALYSPPDHGFPEGVTPEDLRTKPPDQYGLRETEHRHTEKGRLKPDPNLLRDIIDEFGSSPTRAIYVGDSLMKDVAMAQEAGILDVHAQYGVVQDRGEYDLLRRVSHWTEQDVERERQIHSRGEVTPTYTLRNSFAELLQLFTFEVS